MIDFESQLSEFIRFPLPENQIAAEPTGQRCDSRLLIVDRREGTIKDVIFREIFEFISPNDLLVFNRTKVRKALTSLVKPTGGKVEVIWMRELDKKKWLTFGETSKLKPGLTLNGPSGLKVTCLNVEGRFSEMAVDYDDDLEQWFLDHGSVPLPPYIRKRRKQVPAVDDEARYQTIYAREIGSIAAPTAGLHFDKQLFREFDAKGIQTTEVLLSVGPGTFTEVQIEEVDSISVLPEFAELSQTAANAMIKTRQQGGRTIPVGTTSLRTLEGLLLDQSCPSEQIGEVDITVKPGFDLRWTDGLLTNFHLPNTTLRLLVAAVAGPDLALRAYRMAVEQNFRFYSYGDAMLIL